MADGTFESAGIFLKEDTVGDQNTSIWTTVGKRSSSQERVVWQPDYGTSKPEVIKVDELPIKVYQRGELDVGFNDKADQSGAPDVPKEVTTTSVSVVDLLD